MADTKTKPVIVVETAYPIEKAVPMPPVVKRSRRYPFGQMEIGDSIFVPESSAHRARSAASWSGRRHGRAFATRKQPGGIRVWRLS